MIYSENSLVNEGMSHYRIGFLLIIRLFAAPLTPCVEFIHSLQLCSLKFAIIFLLYI